MFAFLVGVQKRSQAYCMHWDVCAGFFRSIKACIIFRNQAGLVMKKLVNERRMH
jgi:hypothetical protein